MRPSIVMMENNSTYYNFIVFAVNSGFQLLFKHSTVLCTIDHLSLILVVLENGLIKSKTVSSSLCQEKAHF